MNDLQKQHAVAYTHRGGSHTIKIPFVKDVPNRRRSNLAELYAERLSSASDIHKETGVAFDAVVERAAQLKEVFDTGEDDEELFSDEFDN